MCDGYVFARLFVAFGNNFSQNVNLFMWQQVNYKFCLQPCLDMQTFGRSPVSNQ